MKKLLIFSCIYLLHSCNSVKMIPKNSDIQSLPNRYQLSERISSCEESVLYMKSIITPNEVNTKIRTNLEYPNLGEISLNILNDRNNTKINDLHLFYININCLKTMPKDDLLKLLLSQENYAIVSNLLNTEKGRSNRFYFEGEFKGFKCFTLVINKNEIESFNWCITDNSHGY